MRIKNAYQLRFLLVALAFVALGIALAWPLAKGWEPVHIAAILLLIGLLMGYLLKIANFVPAQVNYFLRSLLSHDYMIHFPPTKDAELEGMYDNMNRIIGQYRDSLLDIEYKQKYYDRLLRIMTHELRNSMTPIVTLSSDMLKRPESYTPQRLHEGMEVIHEQCVSVKTFLDSYHKLTHLPEPKKTVIEVEKLFNQLKILLNNPAVHFSWGEGMTLYADEGLLTQVLTNLIKNACEATEGQENALVRVVASVANGSPYIQVDDNGPGIPEEIRDEVFLPFYTTKEEGTGIGLCLSRQIMRQHGGDLKLLPTHVRGAAFMVML